MILLKFCKDRKSRQRKRSLELAKYIPLLSSEHVTLKMSKTMG